MNSAFIFQNQHQQYLNKNGDWVDGSESQSLVKVSFKDEALNVKAEYSVKNPDLRVSIVSCQLNAKGHPQIKLDGNLEGNLEDNSERHDESTALQENLLELTDEIYSNTL